MTTSMCAYCGAPAENPAQLGFAIEDEDEGVLAFRLPLCLACSQSWCLQPNPSAMRPAA